MPGDRAAFRSTSRGSMPNPEERLKILRLVEEKKITAREAARLLGALGKAEGRAKPTEKSRNEARWLRIKVTPLRGPGERVDVNLPVELVDLGLRLGARFVPDMEGLATEDIVQAMRSGLHGKLLDLTDEKEGRRFEVYLE